MVSRIEPNFREAHHRILVVGEFWVLASVGTRIWFGCGREIKRGEPRKKHALACRVIQRPPTVAQGTGSVCVSPQTTGHTLH